MPIIADTYRSLSPLFTRLPKPWSKSLKLPYKNTKLFNCDDLHDTWVP